MIARMRLSGIIRREERKDKRNLREKGDDISSRTGRKEARRSFAAELTECNISCGEKKRGRLAEAGLKGQL